MNWTVKRMGLMLALIGGFMQITFGQGKDNPLLPTITLVSPEAASLGKYGVWPVSQYTGVPNISVPVYNININGFTLPITLNYHAGGVKIDDKAPWVGTNWSLSAGGMIGLTMVGIADEDNGGVAANSKFGARLKSYYDLVAHDDYDFFLRVRRGEVDTESDVYYYNFAGLSGKLLVDSNLNVRTIPASNLKFRLTPFTALQPNPPVYTTTTPRWEIADAGGNIYRFGIGEMGVERSNIKQSSGQVASQGITALNLVQIILANKADTINFEYEEKNEYYALPYTQSCRWVTQTLSNPGVTPDGTVANNGPGCPTYNQLYLANKTLYNGAELFDAKRSYSSVWGYSKLKRITWRGGKVEFNAASTRQDMVTTTGKMLDSIVVYNKQNEKIKGVSLQYAYVSGRYYLDSLKESGSAASLPLKYGFSYLNRAALPPSEPEAPGTGLNPYAQDHWGYYNAATGNANLLAPDGTAPSSATAVLSSDREPDTIAVQYGTLNRITYPTGGYTEFKYEANRYDPQSPANGGPPAPIIAVTTTAAMAMTQPVGRAVNFQVPFDQTNGTIQMQFNDYAHPPNKRDAVFQYVRIEKLNSLGNYVTLYYWDAFNNFPSSGVTANPRGYYDFIVNAANINLTAGTYRLIVNDSCPMYIGTPPSNCLEQNYPDADPNDDTWIIPMVTATLNYRTYDIASNELPVGGGLRVREITSFSSDNIKASRKQFRYQPGKLLISPGYRRSYERTIGVLNSCQGVARLTEVNSSSQVILGFTQGAAVGYTGVTEYDLDDTDTNLGYTSYNFSFTPDSLNTLYISSSYWPEVPALDPTFPANSFDHKRGLLLSKTQYKRTGVNYIKVDSVDNKYDFDDAQVTGRYYSQRNLRIRQMLIGNMGGTPLEESSFWSPTHPGYAADFSYSYYNYYSTWVRQLSTEHVVYDENGTNPLTDLTKYYYDNAAHMAPTRVETTSSDGRTLMAYTSYPQDYAAGNTAIDDMAAANIVKPIEAVSYQVTTGNAVSILKGLITVYKPGGKGLTDRLKVLETAQPVALSGFRFSNTSQGLLPHATAVRTVLTPDSRYTDRATINVTDTYGNTSEQQKANDVKEVYFWGYKSQYPVAKIIGVDHNTAKTYITQSILDNAVGGSDDAALRTELNKLRNIPGALVVTYTYKPLVGITSETDVRGTTTFYEYDELNRLKLVRDKDGNILKQFSYVYNAE